MRFRSILAPEQSSGHDSATTTEPAIFHDLNLDLVIESITAGRADYDLKPIYYTPVHDIATVRYRHEVLHDLQHVDIRRVLEGFADRMRTMRRHREQMHKLRNWYQKQSWFTDVVDVYCDAVSSVAAALSDLEVASTGLRAFRDYLAQYVGSTTFTSLAEETRTVRESLAAVEYCVHVKGGRVTVSKYQGEPDYSVKVARTFAKFRQGPVRDRLVNIPNYVDMNHIEEQIVALVARLFPDVFGALEDYCRRHGDYLDPTIGTFDREVQFYLAYLAYIYRFTAAGLPMCYPTVSMPPAASSAHQAYDIALADKLVTDNNDVVCNDFTLADTERILVVTGPNQGGKTTFARMFGQLHYLAGLGLLVPAQNASLTLPDRIFTHFEREENIETLRGKLDDELVRIRDILDHASSDSVVIMNESFTSTTLHDALFLGKEVLRKLLDLGPVGIYVTFVDELASLGPGTASMVATVDPTDPAIRTFQVVRKPADGLAYAAAIAAKYGLTYESLRNRIAG